MKSTLIITLAVSATALVAGCGGGDKTSSTPSSSPSASTAAAVTSDQTKAASDAAVLTAADLPGFTAATQTHDPSDDANDAKLATCLGVPTPTYLSRNFGTAFTKGDLEIDSSADVAQSVEAAKVQLAGFTSAKAPDCIKSVLSDLFASSGSTITSFSAKPLPVTIAGSDASFGFTFEFSATEQGQSIQLSGYELGSLVGQVEIDVEGFGTPATPATTDQGITLLTTATGRAKAAL